jgi:hypothetical protein
MNEDYIAEICHWNLNKKAVHVSWCIRLIIQLISFLSK